jgi:hypothetical protein
MKPTEERPPERAAEPTQPSEPTKPEAPQPGARKPASLLQVASAVLWSFFGVRKGRNMLQDMESIKPLHVVIVGVVAGAIFVLTLLVIVRIVIRTAGPAG